MKVKKDFVGADFGTGTGIITILILGKSKVKKMYAFEIQSEVAEMAKRSLQLNNLCDRGEIICADLKTADGYIQAGSLDFVVSNPPYMKMDGIQNPNEKKKISRHEVLCTLEDVFLSSKKLLKEGGTFYLIHRPNRLCDIFDYCRKYRLEPKEIRFVHPYVGKAPNLVLLRMVKGGKPDMKVLDPLYIYDKDRKRTPEIEEIYSTGALKEE